MDIDTSFATRLSETAAKLAAPPPESPETDGPSFADTLARAAQEITETLQRGERAAEAAVSGGGDIQSVVEALTATELALQTAISVRDRVVEAYQEILRMPV